MSARLAALALSSLIAGASALAAQHAPPVHGETPSIVMRAPLDTAQAVNFRVLVQPETVYVGQQATYQLGVFLDESVRDRLRRMEALAPEMRSMMAYDPPAPLAGFPLRTAAHHRYEAHVYQRPVFPLAAGRFAIPPARLVYALPLSYSFFSREESYELRSDSAVIVALEPPAEGRPADWNGAVGSLHASARFDTSATRVGDPVTFTVRVAGLGNVKLLPRPTLTVAWGSTVPTDDRVDLGADSLVVSGSKEFDWVLTPSRSGHLEMPAVRYPFFDPYARHYEVSETAPVALDVLPGSVTALDTNAVSQQRWALRAVYRGALSEPLYRRDAVLWAMLVVPLPALVLAAARRPRRPRRTPSRQAALRALARQQVTDARVVRRTYLGALSERLRVPSVELAEPTALERAARRAGVSAETATAAGVLLAELGTAAFSPNRHPLPRAAERAVSIARAIDAEARTLSRRAVTAALTALLVASVAATTWAGPANDAAQFARGVQAYGRGQYAAAVREFSAIVTRAPRAADAWANLGTAAFAAGDTARAVMGWQRALRLEPMAEDVRDRVDLVQPAELNEPGNVLPIPAGAASGAGLLLWIVGWGLLAWNINRRRPRAGALVAIAAACVLALATAALDHRADPRNLSVIRHDATLRILPALSAERAASLRTGEVARVLERDGLWQRVRLGGEQEGWVESTALLPLDAD